MQESVAGEELLMFEDKRIMIVRDNIQAFKHVLALEFVCRRSLNIWEDGRTDDERPDELKMEQEEQGNKKNKWSGWSMKVELWNRLVSSWMSKWVGKRVSEWVSEWVSELVSEWVSGWVQVSEWKWVSEGVSERVSQLMDEWVS